MEGEPRLWMASRPIEERRTSASGSCNETWRDVIHLQGKVDEIRSLKYNSHVSFLGSSTVEQPAVNRRVAGSSPARGANYSLMILAPGRCSGW